METTREYVARLLGRCNYLLTIKDSSKIQFKNSLIDYIRYRDLDYENMTKAEINHYIYRASMDLKELEKAETITNIKINLKK